MANKRMFSKRIVSTDKFLEMSTSTQCLYFHLGIEADDDGFIDNPKRLLRTLGCAEDDLKLLILKGYIFPFESGVIVVKDWHVNNYIRPDRYQKTHYLRELSQLGLNEDKSYNLDGIPNDNQNTTIGIPSIDKNSIDKNSIDKNSNQKGKPEIEIVTNYFENEELNSKYLEFLEMRKQMKKKATQVTINRNIQLLNKYDVDVAIAMLDNSINNGYQGIFEIKDSKSKNTTNTISNDYLDSL